jgi:preprotein translocase subunit SecG
MELYLNIALIILSVALIAAVLLQAKGGAGMGGILSDSGAVFRTKRGIEKTLFQFTIILAILFIAASLLVLKLG